MASPFSIQSNTLALDREDLCAQALELLPPRRARLRKAIDAIAAENSASAQNGPLPSDPNVLLLSEIARQLEGSILSADRRHAVLARAETLGIRPFDASLLIAVAQDRARRGESLSAGTVPFQPTRVRPYTSAGLVIALWVGAAAVGVILAVFGASWLLN